MTMMQHCLLPLTLLLLLLSRVVLLVDAVTPNAVISVKNAQNDHVSSYLAAMALFGRSNSKLTGLLVLPPVDDALLCNEANGLVDYTISASDKYDKDVLLVPRGNCTFERKTLSAQRLGASGIIIYNTLEGEGYKYNETSQQIILPQPKLDYECQNGQSTFVNDANMSLPQQHQPYNSTQHDAFWTLDSPDNVCVLDPPNKCDSNRCFITDIAEDDNGNEVYQACCAWDILLAMQADDTLSEKPDDIMAVFCSMQVGSELLELLQQQQNNQDMIQVTLSERFKPRFNVASFLLWMFATWVTGFACWYSAKTYRHAHAILKHHLTHPGTMASPLDERYHQNPPPRQQEQQQPQPQEQQQHDQPETMASPPDERSHQNPPPRQQEQQQPQEQQQQPQHDLEASEPQDVAAEEGTTPLVPTPQQQQVQQEEASESLHHNATDTDNETLPESHEDFVDEDDDNMAVVLEEGQTSSSQQEENATLPSSSSHATSHRRFAFRNAAQRTTTSTTASTTTTTRRQGNNWTTSPDGALELNLWHAVGFVVVASTILLLLFYFQFYRIITVLYGVGCSGAVAQLVFRPLYNYGAKLLGIADKFSHQPIMTTTNTSSSSATSCLCCCCTALSWSDVLSAASGYTLGAMWLYVGFTDDDLSTNAFYWITQNVMGACLCILFLSVLKLNSIKVATALLTVAFIYDIFFVFLTPYIFNGDSIMVTVATGGGPSDADENYCEKYPDEDDCKGGTVLPMLLTIPRINDYRRGASLLGLGDIVLPGLLISFAARLDEAKRLVVLVGLQVNKVPVKFYQGYFFPLMVAYAIGLLCANVAVVLMEKGQPALLYLVPACLGTMVVVGWHELGELWKGPKVIRWADNLSRYSGTLTDRASLTEETQPATAEQEEGVSNNNGIVEEAAASADNDMENVSTRSLT